MSAKRRAIFVEDEPGYEFIDILGLGQPLANLVFIVNEVAQIE